MTIMSPRSRKNARRFSGAAATWSKRFRASRSRSSSGTPRSRWPAYRVVHGHAADDDRGAARGRLVPAGERDHRGDVRVRPQLEVAAVHARGRVLGGRVDHRGDELALGVLRQRAAEIRPHAPGAGGELLERQAIERQAAQHDETLARADLLVAALELLSKLAEAKVVFAESVDGSEASAAFQRLDR